MNATAADLYGLRVPKTAELVARHIRRQIVSGNMRQNDALPTESALMEEFSISRPTLREAFRILESEGLITVRRGARGGARIQEPSADVVARYAGVVLQHRSTTLDDVFMARVLIESPAVRMLAERRDRATSANALQAQLDATDAFHPEHFHDFNSRVIELTGNQTLMLLAKVLMHISAAAAAAYTRRGRTDQDERLSRRARKARQRVIDLIRAGDGAKAEELWRAHLMEQGAALSQANGDNVIDVVSA